MSNSVTFSWKKSYRCALDRRPDDGWVYPWVVLVWTVFQTSKVKVKVKVDGV